MVLAKQHPQALLHLLVEDLLVLQAVVVISAQYQVIRCVAMVVLIHALGFILLPLVV